MSFRHADNTLFGFGFGFKLATIDTATGLATEVGQTTEEGAGLALAFSPDDTLFHAESDNLRVLDQVTGATTLLEKLDFSPPADNFPRFNAMDFLPGTALLFGSLNDTFPPPQAGPSENYLAFIDTTAGGVAIIGPTVTGLDALAWAPTSFLLDVDDDGLVNGLEALLDTDPNDPDTDDDGLLDGQEVNLHGTDPLRADTDADGFDDATEISQGTNPLDATEHP
jgi:hypothetical protein